MRLRIPTLIAALAVSIAAPVGAHGFPGSDVDDRPHPDLACHVGVYRLPDGALVDVAPQTTPALRWRMMDGSTGRMTRDAQGTWVSTRGWTGRVEGPQPQLGECADERLTLDGRTGQRVDLSQVETTFAGYEGTRLRGRLVLPPGSGPVPIIVEIHGSEGASALDFNWFQRMGPAAGVGVFVYAKRGSGGSEGEYTQDFDVLAGDAAAAAIEARRLAGDRAGRIGLHGASQGGWIAPLAASWTDVDFLVVGYGLAVNFLGENRAQTLQGLAAAGWGPAEMAEAEDVIDAAGDFLSSGGAVGFGRIEALRSRYSTAPWWDDLEGEFTSLIVKTNPAELMEILPRFQVGTSFTYEPLPVLRALDTPMLWVLAAEDTDAPPEETRANLVALAADGRPVTVLEYPDTDHGILLFETGPDGARTPTGYAPGNFQAVIDWAAHGRLDGDYGTGVVLARPASTGTLSAD